MKSRSVSCLFFLFLFVVGIGVSTSAGEEPVTDQELPVATLLEVAPAESEDSNTPEPVCTAERQTALAFSGSAGIGFPLCTSQAHCESLCAPFGGICFRQFCICD